MCLGLAAALLLLPSGSFASEPPAGSPTEIAPPERREVPVASLDLEVSEGFPSSAVAILRGALPDGCSAVDSVEQIFSPAARTYRLTASSVRPSGASCTQVLTPFEVRVPLIDAALAGGELVVESGEVSARFEAPAPEDLPMFVAPSPEESVRVCLVAPALCFEPPRGWRRDRLALIWESPAFLSARLGVRWHAEAPADPVALLPAGGEIHERTRARMGAAAGVRFAVRREHGWSEHFFVPCGDDLECELWLEAPSEPLLDAAGEDFWRLVRFAIRY